MKTNFVQVIDRLSKVEESNIYQTKKLDEIHKILLGNGQPGIITEWNQWKGGVRFFGWVIGIIVSILGLTAVLLITLIIMP